MLVLHKLKFTFVDTDTGEVIRQYRYQQSNDDAEKFDVQNFVSDKLLASFVSSFKRGCFRNKNLTLQIDFNTEKIF